MQTKFLIAWAYIKEIVLAGLLYVILLMFFSAEQIGQPIVEFWAHIAAFALGPFAACIAILIYCGQIFSTSDFGIYLKRKKASDIYIQTVYFQALVYVFAIIIPIIAALFKSIVLSNIACWYTLYACINVLSLVSNITNIIQLQMQFNSEKKQMLG